MVAASWAFLALLCSFAAAQLSNSTIDDADPSIVYSPPGVWQARKATCSDCTADNMRLQLDASKVHLSTYHQATSTNSSQFEVSASISFIGVTVYVQCIVASSPQTPLGESNMVFTVDGNTTYPPFTQEPTSSGRDTSFQYQHVVFNSGRLSPKNENHILNIRAIHEGDDASIILLDSITFSHYPEDMPTSTVASASSIRPSPPLSTASGLSPSDLSAGASTSSHSSHTAQIAGGVVGSIALLILIALGLLVYRRRRNGRPLLPFFRPSTNPDEPKEGGGARLERKYTFNPSLLVRARELAKKASTPSLRNAARRRPAPLEDELFQAPNNNSTRDLRQSAVPDSGVLYSANDRLLSIYSWRNNTQREVASSPPPVVPPDASEALSSYYDDQTDIGPSPASLPPQRQQPPVKIWAVMNK